MERIKIKHLFLAFGILSLALACSENNDGTADTEYPVIDASFTESFPQQCSVVKRGKMLVFRARFTDNVALGSFTVNVHNNFNHHSHTTEYGECADDPEEKTPVDPFTYNKSFDIPGAPRTYEAELEITIPDDVDPGDYHFEIRVVDQTGWQTLRGLSIKIQ